MKHNYTVRIVTAILLLALAVMAVLPASALTVGKQDPALSIVSTLASGTYDGVQSVILKATDGAEIYYTTDRTIPTKETGIRYNGSLTVGREDTNSVTYLTAVAEKDGLYSRVYRWTYTINPPSRNLVNSSTGVKVVDYAPFNGNADAPFLLYHTSSNVTLEQFATQLTSNTVGDGQNSYAYINNAEGTTCLEFDLGGVYTINKLDWQRTAYFNTAADGVYNVRIQVSEDGDRWTEVYYNPGVEEMERSMFGVWNDCKYAEITFAPTAARYVRASAGYANETVFASMINIYEGNFTYTDLRDYGGKNILGGHGNWLTLENHGTLNLGWGDYPVYIQNSQPADLNTFYTKLTDGVIGDGQESFYLMNVPAEQGTTYLKIDLQQEYTLDRFEVQRGVYENTLGPENFKMEGSLNGNEWFEMYYEPGTMVNNMAEQGIWNICNFVSVSIAPTAVRYIRVSVGQPGQMTSLSELRLYAASTTKIQQTVVPDTYFDEYRDPATLGGQNMLLGRGDCVTLQNYGLLNMGSGDLPVYVQSGATIKLEDFYYKLVDGVIGDGHESYYIKNVPADQGTTYVVFDLKQPVTIDMFDAQPGAYINTQGIFNLKLEGSLDGNEWFTMYHEPGETVNTDWEQGPWNQCNFARVKIAPAAVRYVRVSMGQPDEIVGFSEFRLYAANEQIPVVLDQKIAASFDESMSLTDLEAWINAQYPTYEFLVSDETTLTLPLIWEKAFDLEDYQFGGVFTFRGTPDVSGQNGLANTYDTALVLEVTLPVTGPNTRALAALVAQAEALSPDAYAADTWSDMQKSLAAARDVLNNASATQIMVNDAAFALDRDIKALAPAGDTSALEALAADMASLKSETYTKTSFARLTAALEKANSLLKQGNPTQKACDEALAALNSAYGALVDISALTESIKTAEAALDASETYTKSSYDAYTAALAAAKAALEDAADTAAVDAAKAALETAVKNLAKAGDKALLEQMLQDAKTFDEALYTPTTFRDLAAAISAAEALLKADEISAADADAAVTAIRTAAEALVKLGDKTELNTLIETYGTESHFSPSTWSEFKTALDAAKLVAADPEASETSVATSVADLKAAAEKLVRVGDKTELAALLEQPREDESKYTAASYSAYLLAIENAGLVMADPEASEEDVKSALDALKTAIEALAEVSGAATLPADTTVNSDTAEPAEKGCGSVLSGTAVLLAVMGLCACFVRRKEND